MTLIELILKLKDEDSLTQGEAKRLPDVSNVQPANAVMPNERVIASLDLDTIEWLLRLNKKFYAPATRTRG